ncbi:hypothetical protein WJX84_000687 [Apatococcus fuscideae]|uniref:MalT-like TPR region domain-containing protein n=1 Tax=Apatococcus fuscideae TaxID=2026836 RepID=A0AAW1RTV1_9CHLO
MEGINSMEPELGKDAVELAQLWDQLALILFFQDKLQEAEPAAVRSLQISMRHFQPHDAPLAMCQLRLGSIMLAQGKAQDALEPLGAAREVLQTSLGTDFEAVGEAQFYTALARLHLTDRSDLPAVAAFDPDLLQGLEQLKQNAGAGALLTATALREHYRLLEGEMAGENWPAVQALFRQQMRLVSALNPGSEDLSLLAYQFGTLQYCQGNQEEAAALLDQSLSIVKSMYKDSDDQVLLRIHRLGTIKSGRPGEQAEAESLLQRSFKHFSSRLGSDNPLTGEARGYLAVVQLRSLLAGHATADAFTRVLNPAKRKELISEMRAGICSMSLGFGNDHLLVQKALADEAELLAVCGAL